MSRFPAEPSPRLLAGKVALVTGGSRNLGAAISLALARQGANVAIGYLQDRSSAEEVLGQIRAEGVEGLAVQGNLADSQGVRKIVREALEWLGGTIHILVNNVGPFADTPFGQLPEAEWDRIMNSNLKATYLATQLVVPGMRRASWGRIVNLSAGSAYIRNHSVYTLAKSALITLSEALALELGPAITVNAVAPGQIAESGPDISEIDPSFVDRAIAHSPGGRLVTRAEVAQLVAWLCSPAADMITGHTIPVDAGWRLNRF